MPALPNNFYQSNHLGIALTTNSVRAVEVDSNFTIVNKTVQSTQSPIFETQIPNANVIRQTLLKTKEALQTNIQFAAVILPEKYAFTREHTLPKLSLLEADEAIHWQTEKIFPFSSEDVYTDWKLIEKSENKMKLLVVAIPKGILNELKAGFESAGLFPISFEPSASAIGRLIPKEKHGNFIIIELENQGTTATFVRGGISSVTTTTNIHSNMDPQQVLTDLVTSLKTLMQHAKITDDKKTQIYLSGEKASPQIASIIEKQINLPAKVLEVNQIEPNFHLAYTAAISAILPPESEESINLLPPILQKHYQAKTQYKQAKLFSKIAITLSITLFVTSLTAFLLSWRTASQIKTQITSEPPSPPAIELETTDLRPGQVNRKAQRIIKLFPLKTSPEQPLALLLEALPEGIQPIQLTYQANKKAYNLIASAKTREDLFAFQQNLQQATIFENVNLPLSNFGSKEPVEFTVTFNLASQNTNQAQPVNQPPPQP